MTDSPLSQPPSWSELCRVFGRIGLLSFGGPAAQIAVMHRELVDDRPWLDESTFLRGLSFTMLLPGPEAMQLCTYTGWRLRGIGGGLLAGMLFVGPGAVVVAALVWLYALFGSLPMVGAAFAGIKAAVVIIVLQALARLSRKALHTRLDWGLALAGFTALFLFQLPFPIVVLTSGLIGLLRPDQGSDLVQPPQPVTRPLSYSLLICLFWAGLWLLPLILLTVTGQEFLADLGWFFAKLAVVTFGGAYAVLAYMAQTVVDQYGWITTGEMIDALGLAETTPGPLILVTQFVAMLSGLNTGGAGLYLAAGAVALWATFVPCFLWIFAAAPYVETLASQPRLGSALRRITAAVTGVILNLSLWFALHVLFLDLTQVSLGPVSVPWPAPGSLDPRALSLVGAAICLALVLRDRLLTQLAVMASTGLLLFQVWPMP